MAWYNFYMNNDPNAPLARECHSIHTFGGNLLLFGGNNDRLRMDDIHLLDTLTMKWSRIPPKGDPPIKRSAHSSTLVDNRYMYVFGGWDGNAELGDVSIFDIYTQQWTRPKCSGTPPVPRHFHNTAVAGRRLFIFGGYDGIAWRNDIVALNLDTNNWESVNCLPPVENTTTATTTATNSNSPTDPTGGTTTSIPSNTTTLPINGSNTILTVPNSTDNTTSLSRLSSSPVLLPCPGPRASGSCVVLEDNKLLIFGGYNGDEFLNDMWILHTLNPVTNETEYRWEQIKPQTLRNKYKYISSSNSGSNGSTIPNWVGNSSPSLPSSYSVPVSTVPFNPPLPPNPPNNSPPHPSTASNNNNTNNNPTTTVSNSNSNTTNTNGPSSTAIVRHPSLIYTGNVPLYLNVPVAMTLPVYRHISPDSTNLGNAANNLYGGYGYWPAARSGHVAEVYGSLLLVLGGRHKLGRFSDVLIYNLETGLWYEYLTSGYSFIPRKTHAIGRIQDRLWLFGGHDGNGWLGDLLMMDLTIVRKLFSPVLTIPVPKTKFLSTLGHLVPDIDILDNNECDHAGLSHRFKNKRNDDDLKEENDDEDNCSDDGLWSQELLQQPQVHHNMTTSSTSASEKPNSASPWKNFFTPLVKNSSIDPYLSSVPLPEKRLSFLPTPLSIHPPPITAEAVNLLSSPVTFISPSSSSETVTSVNPPLYTADRSDEIRVPTTKDTTITFAPIPETSNQYAFGTTNPTFTDVTFVVDGKYRIRAHKAILSLRCEFFRIMFSSSFTESTSNCVTLPDIDIDTFTVFLRYIYTDTLPFSESLSVPFNPLSVPLLITAQRFTVHRLSRLCQRYLEANLSPENACELFDLADNLHVRPLRRACVQYILDRYPLISRTVSFIQLRAELLRELLQWNALNEEKREGIEAANYERMKLYHGNIGSSTNASLSSPPAGSQQPSHNV